MPPARRGNSEPPLRFRVTATDGESAARAGLLEIASVEVETPVFMPVGTHGAVRAMTPGELRATGSRIVLAKTYHLNLRPGPALVRKLGGLHAFMAWDGPILTDSGGYQVFSLPRKEIHADGVRFKSEVDGSQVELTPEGVMRIQQALGADIVMPLDECTPYPATHDEASRGVGRTLQWLERCVAAQSDSGQALFGIIQGSVYGDLRRASAEGALQFDLPGYAIGGVSVGEGRDELVRVLETTAPLLPADRPRYVMGIGLPEDLLEAIERGTDMFDCVIPTRYARSATLFTRRGRIRMGHRRYRRDQYPIDSSCDCYACRTFTRAYVHHLYASNEILGTILGAIHNVRFYHSLMADARGAITGGDYRAFKRAFLDDYSSK